VAYRGNHLGVKVWDRTACREAFGL
jgi:hypothetical protein